MRTDESTIYPSFLQDPGGSRQGHPAPSFFSQALPC